MKLKRDLIYLIVISLLIALCAQFYYTYNYQPKHQVEVYYNKNQELNKELINVIRDADKFVYFAIYTFTRADIKDALLAAKYRGVEVVGIADNQQYEAIELQRKIVDELKANNIPVFEQTHSSIMHLKTLVTEKAYVSGSYNWTTSATESNDEILEIGKDEVIRKKYENVLKEMFELYGQSSSN